MQIYLPVADMPVDMFLIVAMGAAVGFISGMFGIGGGFLMTPLLIFVGIPPAIAVATQGTQIAASSTTAVLSYWRRRSIDFKLGAVLITGGLAGTLAGVWFFNVMRRLGQLELVIDLAYVTLFGVVGALMLWESARAVWSARRGIARMPRQAGEHAWYLGLPLRLRFHRSRLYGSVIPLLGLAFVIGFAGAVLGIGGGFIIVPALIYLFRVPAAVVVGTSLFQILCTMLAATLLHAVTNQAVDIVLALLLVLGGTFGAQFGARVGQRLQGETFRLLLALVVLLVGIRFAFELTLKPKEPFSLALAGAGP